MIIVDGFCYICTLSNAKEGSAMRKQQKKMEVKQVAFAGSFPKHSLAPADGKPEYAFIGRSNVGKSSLINMLTGRKEVARTSKTPGKTQTLNYYRVNDAWYLVDLPGYGYARISKTKRKEWEKMIQDYMVKRATLQCAVVLIDANVPPQKIDLDFINWLGEMRVPFVIAYTKIDRLSKVGLETQITNIQTALLEHWNELPRQFQTSARKGGGRDELLAFIEETNILASSH
jgi:GTP-binding protein